jgi:hypothetical protein
LAIAFSRAKPFRKPISTNIGFVIVTLILTVFAFYIVLFQHYWTDYVFYMLQVPEVFRYKMLMIIFGCCVATYLFEAYVVRFLEDFEYNRKERNRAKAIALAINYEEYKLKELNLQAPQGSRSKKYRTDKDGMSDESYEVMSQNEGRERNFIH